MRTTLWATMGLMLAGCGGGGSTDAGTDAGPVPTYEEVQTIFSASCAIANTTCHSATGHQRMLTLTPSESYAGIVGVTSQEVSLQRVNPGHPESSWLQIKIEGTLASVPECVSADGGVTPTCGERMPMVSGITLTPTQIATIRAWIAGGAPGPSDAGVAQDAGGG